MKQYKEQLTKIKDIILLARKEQSYIAEEYIKEKAILKSLGFDYDKMDSQLPSDMMVELYQDGVVIKVPHWVTNLTSTTLDKESSKEYQLYCKTQEVYDLLQSHRLFIELAWPPEPSLCIRYRIYSFQLPEELREIVSLISDIKSELEVLDALADSYDL